MPSRSGQEKPAGSRINSGMTASFSANGSSKTRKTCGRAPLLHAGRPLVSNSTGIQAALHQPYEPQLACLPNHRPHTFVTCGVALSRNRPRPGRTSRLRCGSAGCTQAIGSRARHQLIRCCGKLTIPLALLGTTFDQLATLLIVTPDLIRGPASSRTKQEKQARLKIKFKAT
jgi:hypothetical protein